MELTPGSPLPLTRCLLDWERGVVVPRNGDPPIRLTTRECALVRHLAERAPEAVTRDELLSRVWGTPRRR